MPGLLNLVLPHEPQKLLLRGAKVAQPLKPLESHTNVIFFVFQNAFDQISALTVSQGVELLHHALPCVQAPALVCDAEDC